jgi:hypothetical protein
MSDADESVAENVTYIAGLALLGPAASASMVKT